MSKALTIERAKQICRARDSANQQCEEIKAFIKRSLITKTVNQKSNKTDSLNIQKVNKVPLKQKYGRCGKPQHKIAASCAAIRVTNCDTIRRFTCPEITVLFKRFFSSDSFFLLTYAEIRAFDWLKSIFRSWVKKKKKKNGC